ncbi:protein PFC0760c-like isoform X2 [Linepithema humile]
MRKKQKDNKNQNKRFSDTDTSLDDNSNDENIYPITSFLKSRKSVNDTFQLITVNEDKSTEKNENNVTNSTSITNSVSEEAFLKYQSLNSKYYEKVLKEINLLHLKVNDMLDSINILIRSTKVNTETVINNDRSEVLKIIHLFPMNEESLIEVEDWINKSIDNKVALTEELSRIGGSSLKELIKRIMYRILLNEVGMLYSWEGAKKKKAFKNLSIAAVILDVVRKSSKFQSATELETINHIKAWLVRSKDRYINAQKKSNQVQSNTPDKDT